MGKNNKKRRAAKARNRQQKRRSSTGGARSAGWAGSALGIDTEHDRVTALYGLNQLARQRNDDAATKDTVSRLVRCSPALVAGEIERDIARILRALWHGGWLPGEVIRHVKRVTSANGERLVSFAVAADHVNRPASTLHPKWSLHVADLGLPDVAGPHGWLRSGALNRSYTVARDWSEVIDLASSVTFSLSDLGRLDEMIPPPGTERAAQSIVDLTGLVADPILTRVRHLLAQAESTNFDAEAGAFTAKAQELMARHAIDAALVWAREERDDSPITTRVPLDDPYVDAKSLLLTVVAEQSQCRAVIHPAYAMASLVGFASDLVWCETLYTSLLVQAQRELARVGASDRAGGRQRSRSFRLSFLTAYAERIDERLAEVNAHVQAHANGDDPSVARSDGIAGESGGSGAALLPVLASRRSAVDESVDARFGELASGHTRQGNDWQGRSAGRFAADQASLTRGDLAARRAS